MGTVYNQNAGLIKDYAAEPTGVVTDYLIDPSQPSAQYDLAALTTDEVTTILKKLDSMTPGWGPQATMMVAEGAFAVLQAVRLVKAQAKQNFRGIYAQGGSLDLRWLRPKDVGGAILRGSAAAGALGLYAGAGGAVYTWLSTLVVNTTNHMIPSQTNELYAAVVYLGFIDPIEVSAIDQVQFTLYGVSVTPQQADFKMLRTFDSNDTPAAKLEKPIIVPPLGTQALDVYSYRSGDTKIQPVAILVARASELTI